MCSRILILDKGVHKIFKSMIHRKLLPTTSYGKENHCRHRTVQLMCYSSLSKVEWETSEQFA